MPNNSTNWTREETLAAFNLYCRTPFGRLHSRNPEIIAVAERIGRTPGAVAMKCCNIASLDTDIPQKGLGKASQIEKIIWQEFATEPEEVGFQSAQAYDKLFAEADKPVASQVVETPPTDEAIFPLWEDLTGKDKAVLVKVRTNQHLFRSLVLTSYREACAVCSLPIKPLLVASHIVPWSVNAALRMNPHNGLCLCTLHDKAFDTGLMVISDDYTVSFTAKLSSFRDDTSVQNALTQYEGNTLRLPERWLPLPAFLVQHRQMHGAA